MSEQIMNVKIKSLYKPESEWTASNPLLERGEVAYSSDKEGSYKIGNGFDRWSSLPYCKVPSSNVTDTIVNGGTDLPTATAVKTYVDTAVSGASNYLGTVTALTGLSTSAKKGDFYRVSTAFSTAKVGDLLIAEKTNPTQTIDGTNWSVIHNDTDTNKYADLVDVWTGTTAEYNAQKASIANGSYVNITDDVVKPTNLASVAYTGLYSDLSGRPTSLPADGGNAATVNGHTVKIDVPAEAKFTDTIVTYSNATTSTAGLMSPGDKQKVDGLGTQVTYSLSGTTLTITTK